MTPSEAAQLIGVHWTTVYKAIREGKLPAKKTASGTTLDRGDVTAFKTRLKTDRRKSRARVAKPEPDPVIADLPVRRVPGYRLVNLAERWGMGVAEAIRFLAGKKVGMFRDDAGKVLYDQKDIDRVERDHYHYIEALH